ncbi:MAG TPA: hypothetical protein VF821_08710, partial [Lentzea sp.]
AQDEVKKERDAWRAEELKVEEAQHAFDDLVNRDAAARARADEALRLTGLDVDSAQERLDAAVTAFAGLRDETRRLEDEEIAIEFRFGQLAVQLADLPAGARDTATQAEIDSLAARLAEVKRQQAALPGLREAVVRAEGRLALSREFAAEAAAEVARLQGPRDDAAAKVLAARDQADAARTLWWNAKLELERRIEAFNSAPVAPATAPSDDSDPEPTVPSSDSDSLTVPVDDRERHAPALTDDADTGSWNSATGIDSAFDTLAIEDTAPAPPAPPHDTTTNRFTGLDTTGVEHEFTVADVKTTALPAFEDGGLRGLSLITSAHDDDHVRTVAEAARAEHSHSLSPVSTRLRRTPNPFAGDAANDEAVVIDVDGNALLFKLPLKDGRVLTVTAAVLADFVVASGVLGAKPVKSVVLTTASAAELRGTGGAAFDFQRALSARIGPVDVHAPIEIADLDSDMPGADPDRPRFLFFTNDKWRTFTPSSKGDLDPAEAETRPYLAYDQSGTPRWVGMRHIAVVSVRDPETNAVIGASFPSGGGRA